MSLKEIAIFFVIMTSFVNKIIGGDCPVTFWTFAF